MKTLHVFTILSTAKAFFDGQFRYFTDHGQQIHVVSETEEDPDFSARNNITYHRVDIQRRMSPLADLKAIRALVSLIRREKFDLVVGHTPKGAMVAMIAARLAGVRHRVFLRHGLVYTTAKGAKRTLLKNIERLTAAFATNIINVSHSIAEIAVKDSLNSAAKQTVIGAGTCGGIDTQSTFNPSLVSEEQKAELKKQLGISPDDFVAGFVGRICKEKGIRELIDGFNDFRKKQNKENPGKRAKLLIVGPYDTRDILPDDYKAEIDSNPDIIAPGRVDKKLLPAYYSIMDVYLFPSYREGFNTSILEANAMGIPAVVSRAHGCIDSIKEGVSGEYTDISPEGVCKALTRMSDPEVLGQYAGRCREHVVSNFEHHNVWPLFDRYYKQICSESQK